MKYQRKIAPAAHRDIVAIKNYIALDKPGAAVKTANRIYDSFDLLQDNPNIGGSIEKKFGVISDYLFWVVAPYIVFYKFEDNCVGVYRVLDGRSDYLAKLGLKTKQK